MASGTNVCLGNFVDIGFGDIDIDMEVKSEHDSEDENNLNSSECDEHEVEFILPEQRHLQNINCEELPDFAVNTIKNSYNRSTSGKNFDDCNTDIEDEPEVEIDEVTVRQELFEAALDPSLLLYVDKAKNSVNASKSQIVEFENQFNKNQLDNISNKPDIGNTYYNNEPLSSLSYYDKPDDNFFPVLAQNNIKKDCSVTAALRKVKRKPCREPLEPLKEIDCSSVNASNTVNIDNNRPRIDKYVKCDTVSDDNEENANNDECNEVFCDAPSPCDSNSDIKDQKHIAVVMKRKRGRPRLKSNTYIEKFLTKRKGKRKTPIKKIKIKLKPKSNMAQLITEERKDGKSTKNSLKKTNQVVDSPKNACIEKVEGNVQNENFKYTDTEMVINSNVKKLAKAKKVKNNPSIFDEIKMDYTVLNESEQKEKPKRVRKRDKRSREMAAQNKPDSFDCSVCGRQFKEKSHLATHARAHIDVRNFKCNKCGSLFKTKTNLFFHMKTHSDAPFTCEKCNKTYPERKTLMRHIRVVHSSQNIYSCDQCGREFKSMHNLNLHYTLHTGVKPFTCGVCNKSFVYKSTYIAHSKGHEADNSFNCELCPKTYNNKAEFRRLCNHHSEARPWLCTVCGKGYPLKGTLKNHMKTHEPEKPFKCPDCPKSFMKKQSFECHLKIHAGERPQFMCDQCSQSYFNVFALKRHYLKHTSERKFVCEVCHKAFWMKDALKVHMRTHSNIKLFPCVQCPKAFAHKHTLDAHLRTHLDVEPYSCNVCQKTFIHKYNLARHERQHTTPTVVPIVPPPIVPVTHQTVPISIMMLPTMAASPQSTLHNYTLNAACL